MEGGDPFGLFGDPDELRARLSEMAEQMQGAQKVAWADNAIKLAVDMTVAAIRTSTSAAPLTSRRSRCATRSGSSSPRP